MNLALQQQLILKLKALDKPQRKALSLIFPSLKKPIILTKIWLNKITNLFHFPLAKTINWYFLPYVKFRHQSLLFRKLGNSDPRLQKQKVTNLKQATTKLNGLIIKPGQTFSFWEIVGRPNTKNGFVNGMLLSNGKVIEGMGGGLCQMANLLHWMFLHTEVEIIERYHHSRDVFPDSGRTLPFGSGATIMYNFVDLKIKNTSDKPIQLKIWLTDKHLKGAILSPQPNEKKFHLIERNHCFVKRQNQYYRYNELWRQVKKNGQAIKTEKILTNFAPVLYEINSEYLQKHQYQCFNFDYQELETQQQLHWQFA